MTELKEMDKIYLEKYGIHVTPYLTYAQIEQMLKAVGEIFDWAERQVSIDMLLLAHTTDIPVEELDKTGHKALFESGLIAEVKKNIINLHDWEKALEYHTSFQKNMATVLKKVTPELMDKVMAIVKPSKNDAELRRMFEKPLKEAVDYIVQKIWNENKELVRQIVYEAYLPKNYNRTGQFQKAWDFDVESSADDEKIAQGAFYYNPNTMSRGSTDPQSSDFGQHISIIDGADMRPYLADIIYNGAYGRAWMNGAGKRDAWDALINSVGKQKMKQWLKEGMQKAGLQGILHTTPIEVKYSK